MVNFKFYLRGRERKTDNESSHLLIHSPMPAPMGADLELEPGLPSSAWPSCCRHLRSETTDRKSLCLFSTRFSILP